MKPRVIWYLAEHWQPLAQQFCTEPGWTRCGPEQWHDLPEHHSLWVLARGARVWLGTKVIPTESGLHAVWASPSAAPKSPLDVTAVLCKVPGKPSPFSPGCSAGSAYLLSHTWLGIMKLESSQPTRTWQGPRALQPEGLPGF